MNARKPIKIERQEFIAELVKTIVGPGVVAEFPSITPDESFDAVYNLLCSYYESTGRILTEDENRRASNRRVYKVFRGLPEMNFEYAKDEGGNLEQKIEQGPEQLHAIVNVKYLETISQKLFEPEWVSPHSPLRRVAQKLSIYFNVFSQDKEDKGLSVRERNSFLSYLQVR